jgi:Ca2+-binding EF-hand superfamily protein
VCDDWGHLQDQQAKDALAASVFLDKLNLKLLERLWVAIKKNCMLNTAAARGQGVYEAISLADFLRLAWQQMPHHSQDDEHFLERLFHCVDRRKKGSVRTTDIATALVLICNADSLAKEKDGLSKLKTLFRIFDADDDSCLTHDEIFDMYLSIKVNDVTKTRQALVADITFDDELSLQEAKRLYELTIELLNVVSDFVIFEEFRKVFDERPNLVHDLLPGAFTLDWILTDYRPPTLEQNTFGSDVRRGLIDAMRRGEEHLDLSKKRGRGMRIMQNCLNLVSHKPVSSESNPDLEDTDENEDKSGDLPAAVATASPDSVPTSARTNASLPSLPKITSATKSKTQRPAKEKVVEGSQQVASSKDKAEEDDSDDDESSEDEMKWMSGESYAHPPRDRANTFGSHSIGHSVAAVVTNTPRGQSGGGIGAMGKANLPIEALELPIVEKLPFEPAHAMRFRTMTLDAKTQQAFLRDKKDVNRSLRYQCLVCAVNHDFRLSKIATSAEHQHW